MPGWNMLSGWPLSAGQHPRIKETCSKRWDADLTASALPAVHWHAPPFLGHTLLPAEHLQLGLAGGHTADAVRSTWRLRCMCRRIHRCLHSGEEQHPPVNPGTDPNSCISRAVATPSYCVWRPPCHARCRHAAPSKCLPEPPTVAVGHPQPHKGGWYPRCMLYLYAVTLTGSSPPDGHLYEPDWHVLPPLHRVPHLPQWLLLARRSVSHSGLVESQLP